MVGSFKVLSKVKLTAVTCLIAAAGFSTADRLKANETITYSYDAKGRLVETRFENGVYAGTVLFPEDPGQWNLFGNGTRQASGTLGGSPAYLIGLSADGWGGLAYDSYASMSYTVGAGESVMFELNLRAVAGSSDSHAIGIGSLNNGWGSSSNSTATILSGPGQVQNVTGALWTVSGLSTSSTTRVRIVRTLPQADSVDADLYPDYSGGFRNGQQVLAAALTFATVAGSRTDRFCLDAAGNRTTFASGENPAQCP